MLAILTSLLMLAPQVEAVAPAADDGPAPRVIVLKGDANCVTANADVVTSDDGTCTVKVKTLAMGAEWPKVWIGVRLTPLPAPLAAHLGEQGVMVGNVVKGSPADQAGLQQYDVIVSFNDQELATPTDLSAAIGKIAAGAPARLGIIRKAQPQEVQITPVERAADAPIELKYDEPEAAMVTSQSGVRALQQDANGNWFMQDLGQLRSLPDLFTELQGKFNVHINPDDATVKKFMWHDMDGDLLKGLCVDDADDCKVELQISVDKDGGTTNIRRAADGKITVTKTDAQGQESTATYENADALQQADPETFEILSRHEYNGQLHMFNMGPLGNPQFKLQFRKQLHDTLKNSQEAMEKAHQEAMLKAQEAFKHMQMKVQNLGPDGTGKAFAQTLVVTRGDNGVIKITQGINGETKQYTFKNIDELKTQNPELYAQVKDCLEGGPSDDED